MKDDTPDIGRRWDNCFQGKQGGAFPAEYNSAGVRASFRFSTEKCLEAEITLLGGDYARERKRKRANFNKKS